MTQQWKHKVPVYSLPLIVAADHAGFYLKKSLMEQTPRQNWKDLGSPSPHRTDYPFWAEKLCRHIQPGLFGVLICGSGQGMAIKANRHPHIRAALCLSLSSARLSRLHNDANVLCLAGRVTPPPLAREILQTFLTTDFNRKDPAHERRVRQLGSRW